jgi:hypothetical protein
MQAKTFTLQEARAALPRVKSLMRQAQEARREIVRLRPEAWPALRGAASNGGNHAAGELVLQFERLENGIKGIAAMGILVKDVDTGLIDFLGKRDERDVYLCWRYDEEDISFWHEIDGGVAGRRPIDERIR